MSDFVSGKRRVAVLMTGVPRGYERCVGSLRFMLEECDATYHAVIREEFATGQTLEDLKSAFPGIVIIVVPAEETRKAVASFVGRAVAPTLIMMWHEIAYAAEWIANLYDYQCILRMRFDIFLHRQYLPEVPFCEDAVWLPSQMNWSGSNDMICLAAPQAFRKYANTFSRLDAIVGEGIGIPEAIIARSIAMAGLIEHALNVFFILYREILFSELSDAQLSILAHMHPALSTYKLGGRGDSPERRARAVADIEALTRQEHFFPIYETRNAGSNFYPPEKDARDGSSFRWMSMHAHMNVAISRRARSISFVVHFHVADWNVSQLKVLVDGFPLELKVVSTDAHGRARLFASLEGVDPRRPWSKIGFSCGTIVVPSESGANSNDHRALSVAIGVPQIDEWAGDSRINASP
ncbi:hypothetical protein PQQ63_27025 [Paraburkholderia metrosideri]|uniref:Glycosyltransferase family 1 protein n=1 Tax=Paraburkholderia metrosideri TaxID=580937 RepID=A0ABW9E2G4_9BURK